MSASLRKVGDAKRPSPRPVKAPEAPRLEEPPAPDAARQLPFDLFLLTRTEGLPLFRRGPVDELTFFQRRVRHEEELEYVGYRDTDRGSLRGYGVFRFLGPSERLFDLSAPSELWDRLSKQHRMRSLPEARSVLLDATRSYDPYEGSESGLNRLETPAGGIFEAPGQRDVTLEHAFQVVRSVCRPRQLIAWIEAGIPRLRSRAILHRYYLDARLNLYLVRQTSNSRRLFVPQRAELGRVAHLQRRHKLA